MKKLVRWTVLAAAAVATLSAVVIPISISNGQSASANPLVRGDNPITSQTSAQRLGLSFFPDVQLTPDRSFWTPENSRSLVALKSEQLLKLRANNREGAARTRGALREANAEGVTILQAYNPSQPQTGCYITLPAGSGLGGPTNVNQLVATDVSNGQNVPINSILNNPQQGKFLLNTGQKVNITAPNNNNILDGFHLTFAAVPQCPCTSGCAGDTPGVAGPPLPNGTNFVEAVLNPGGNNQETVDISCVNGANSTTQVTFTDSNGPNWNNGSGNNNVTQIQNGAVNVQAQTDANCPLTGVFAFNATLCTSAGGGACPPNNMFCSNSEAHCNIQRARNNRGFGGTVLCTYVGPL